MSTINDGGPAFPAHDYLVGQLQEDGFQKLGESRGMSLRDWLAGQALGGILADTNVNETANRLASIAYDIADAMISQRNKKPDSPQ